MLIGPLRGTGADRVLRAYAPAALWAALLLALGGWSGAPGPPGDLPLDKAAHLVLYAVLGLLTGLGWRRMGGARTVFLPLVLALLVGPADELHQRSVPGRSAEWGDLAADTAGVLLGCALGTRRPRSGSRDETRGRRGPLHTEKA